MGLGGWAAETTKESSRGRQLVHGFAGLQCKLQQGHTKSAYLNSLGMSKCALMRCQTAELLVAIETDKQTAAEQLC